MSKLTELLEALLGDKDTEVHVRVVGAEVGRGYDEGTGERSIVTTEAYENANIEELMARQDITVILNFFNWAMENHGRDLETLVKITRSAMKCDCEKCKTFVKWNQETLAVIIGEYRKEQEQVSKISKEVKGNE